MDVSQNICACGLHHVGAVSIGNEPQKAQQSSLHKTETEPVKGLHISHYERLELKGLWECHVSAKSMESLEQGNVQKFRIRSKLPTKSARGKVFQLK